MNGIRILSGMGRKKKKPSERRTNTLHIKMTDGERAEIEAAAAAVGADVSTWVRLKILEFIRKQENSAH